VKVWACKNTWATVQEKGTIFRTTKQRRAGSCLTSVFRGQWEYAELWSQGIQHQRVWRTASSKKFGSAA